MTRPRIPDLGPEASLIADPWLRPAWPPRFDESLTWRHRVASPWVRASPSGDSSCITPSMSRMSHRGAILRPNAGTAFSRPHQPSNLPLLDASYLHPPNRIPSPSPSDLSPSATSVLRHGCENAASRLHSISQLAKGWRIAPWEGSMGGQHERPAWVGGNIVKDLSAFVLCLSLRRASLLIGKFLLASSHFHDSGHIGFAHTLSFPRPVTL